jgi:hypothetical protein
VASGLACEFVFGFLTLEPKPITITVYGIIRQFHSNGTKKSLLKL